jgi:hypothetical protein
MSEPTRVMAGITHRPFPGKDNGAPIPRDEYAAGLVKELSATDRQGTLTIKEADAYVTADLLDELAAVYRGEPLGFLAREMAVKLYDRLGI